VTYRMTGTLRQGATPDAVAGSLRDAFGTSFLITGHITADGSYDLEAVPGPIPEGLKLPWEEDS
jgi:hypothetical protein